MKKSLAAFLLSFVLVSSGCGVVKVKKPEEPVVQRTSPINLDFEEGEPGVRVTGWTFTETGEYEIEVVDDVKRSGKQSAHIRAGQGETSWGAFNQNYAGQAFAGKTVRVKAWIKVEEAEMCDVCAKPNLDEASLPEGSRRGAQVRILGFAPDSYSPETLVTPLVMGTQDWTLFEAFTAMPANLDNAIIVPVLWGKGKAWFDDIEILVQ